MKKNIVTLITVVSVILMTGTFVGAEVALGAGINDFPYFHLGALLIGGLIITSLQQKYSKLMLQETVGSFALYAVMVALFTEPVINAIRGLIG